jgi:hypothetical protein
MSVAQRELTRRVDVDRAPEWRRCAHCRQEFPAWWSVQIYCSVRCRRAADNERITGNVCHQCWKALKRIWCEWCGLRVPRPKRLGPNRRYCSRLCGNRASARRANQRRRKEVA